MSALQLAKLIESLPEKMKAQVKPDGKAGDVDPTQVVRDNATEQAPRGDVIAKVEQLSRNTSNRGHRQTLSRRNLPQELGSGRDDLSCGRERQNRPAQEETPGSRVVVQIPPAE
jgi:hypothetical protein